MIQQNKEEEEGSHLNIKENEINSVAKLTGALAVHVATLLGGFL